MIVVSAGIALFIFALIGLRRLLCNMKVVVCDEQNGEYPNIIKKDHMDMSYTQTIKASVLEAQYIDAKKRLDDEDYWGDAGYWVTLAIQRIELAIDSVPCDATTNSNDWVKEVIKKVEASHQDYRENEEDPDGYGSATFHEVMRNLDNL